MSYRVEGKDIVISGFESGIADSPYEGIADMRNIDITTIPGEAMVAFKTQAMTLPPTVTAAAFTVTSQIFTWAGTSTLYDGMAIQLVTTSSSSTSTGVVYYVKVVSSTTFAIYSGLNNAVNPLGTRIAAGNGSGTFSSYTMGSPLDSCSDSGQLVNSISGSVGAPNVSASYIIDSNNYVWLLTPLNSPYNSFPFANGTVYFLGNIGSNAVTPGYGSSICVYSNYIFVFLYNRIDYCLISNLLYVPGTNWVYDWSVTAKPQKKGYMDSIATQDDAMYICNDNAVASILTNAGSTFDPANSATFTSNAAALKLPVGEFATCIAELGTNLLVGGSKSYIYPWDRVSTSYTYPLVVPENFIYKIVSTNTNAYIFAGSRGRIYVTNGTNIDLYKKIPDSVTRNIEPYFSIGGYSYYSVGTAVYWRDQLFFSFVSYTNAGQYITYVAGLWAINLADNSLRLLNTMSGDPYAVYIPVIVPDLMNKGNGTGTGDVSFPYGVGLFCGWRTSFNPGNNPSVGIDASTYLPYSNAESVIECDIIPVGTYLNPFSPSQIEWKTSVPLGAGGQESISLYYRTNLNDSFTLIGTTTATGTTVVGTTTGTTIGNYAISDYFKANFQKAQWLQIKVVMSANSGSPTYCRLTEVRIREWKQ